MPVIGEQSSIMKGYMKLHYHTFLSFISVISPVFPSMPTHAFSPFACCIKFGSNKQKQINNN